MHANRNLALFTDQSAHHQQRARSLCSPAPIHNFHVSCLLYSDFPQFIYSLSSQSAYWNVCLLCFYCPLSFLFYFCPTSAFFNTKPAQPSLHEAIATLSERQEVRMSEEFTAKQIDWDHYLESCPVHFAFLWREKTRFGMQLQGFLMPYCGLG